MEGGWVKNKASVVAPVPIQVAWELWQDRTRIPNWMPWISSVSYLPEDKTKTKWTLSTDQF
jgi:Predicted integral membrane protein